MTRVLKTAALKRFILLSMAMILLLALFTGCGTAAEDAAAPETGEQPSPSVFGEAGRTPEVSPPADAAQTPEARTALPDDVFSDTLNVFSGVAFPEGYTVFAAGFENNVDFYFYELYLTAAGDPEEIITYISNLVGDSAAESLQQNIDYYDNDGGVGIDGRLDGTDFDVSCLITPTEKDDYDYDYVEGCSLRLRASVGDPSGFDRLIADNYNLNSLSDVANYFDVVPITGKSKIYVRKSRGNAQIDAVYNTVEDVAGVMEAMKADLQYQGFDESLNMMHLPDYGQVQNSIMFDTENNSISIFQSLGDSGKSYKDYKTASSALTGLGFANYIESDALCEYRDEAGGLSIAVNIPQWGSRPDEWENSCVQFLKDMNGYGLAIWYYPDEGRYIVQADKDDTSAKFTYSEKTDEVTDEFSTSGEPRDQFVNMLGGAAGDDVYKQCMDIFKDYVTGAFGMSIDALYALAAQE